MSNFQDHLPVIVGVGQITEKKPELHKAKNPIQLMKEAAFQAAEDAGLSLLQLSKVDELIVVKGMRDRMKNPVDALAQMIDAEDATQYMTATGGNSPQQAVNYVAEQISQGKVDFALVAGAEALDTSGKARKAEIKLDWNIPSDKEPVELFPEKPGSTEAEDNHGMMPPSNTYPLFENAIRHYLGRSFSEHQQKLGELLAKFSSVAADNPYAWFPIARSPEEISQANDSNRYVGFPYTKFMNSIMRVNQGAAVIVCSTRKARELDIPESQWVYLNGCGDANDHWYVSERENLYSSPAIKAASDAALNMAGMSSDDIDYFDLYSCFPSAVEVARFSLGIDEQDTRPLTVTGGLPYFGGPGNNYVMHSICSMVEKLRANPGKKGFVNANGWYLTKHAVGIYSTEAPTKPWQREATADIQARVNAQPKTEYIDEYTGAATVESYSFIHDRSGLPTHGIIMARTDDGKRCVAVTGASVELLQKLEAEEIDGQAIIGRQGSISRKDDVNVFRFD